MIANSPQLRRNLQRAKLGGVCAGAADYLGIPPTLVRVTLIIFALCFTQVAVMGYGIAWLLMRP